MSRLGKVFLALSGLSFVVLMVVRLLVGEWSNYMFIMLFLCIFFFALSIIKDFVLYKELFFLRTTKHGLNFGVMFILVLVGIVAVNYVSYVENKKIDVTEEKMNSLSEQSVDILKKLDSDLEIFGFFQAGRQQDEQAKFMFTDMTNFYKYESSKVKVATYDPLKRPDIAKKYNIEAGGEVVLVYKGKQHALTELSEEALTNGIIKITRTKNKVVYFLKGHGERDPASEELEGIAKFKKSLEDAGYEVKPLSLVEAKTVPDDADVVAAIGPKQPLLDFETEALKAYAAKGGHLFLAADPGFNHGMGNLFKTFGIDYKNHYVFDQFGQLLGLSAAVAIGTNYSKTSEITKKFGEMMTAFQLASHLSKSAEVAPDFKFDELVLSSPASFAKTELNQQVRQSEGDPRGPLPLAVSVTGTLAGRDQKEAKEFALVAVGDSDFVTNQMLHMQLNRDLALNSFAFLAKDSELVSIRPKQASGTTLQMTQTSFMAARFGYFMIPVLMLVMSVVVWIRRRGA